MFHILFLIYLVLWLMFHILFLITENSQRYGMIWTYSLGMLINVDQRVFVQKSGTSPQFMVAWRQMSLHGMLICFEFVAPLFTGAHSSTSGLCIPGLVELHPHSFIDSLIHKNSATH